MDLTIGNLKGGVGKTITAVNLACGMAAAGERTLLVNTDPQRSAAKWSEIAIARGGWPSDCVVVSWTDARALGKQIDSMRRDFANIVIDTPPSRSAESSGPESEILTAALMATGNLIVPTSPSAGDLAEIKDTFTLATKVDLMRPVFVSVLLCRVDMRTRSATLAREVLADFDFPVLRAIVPAREIAFAQSFGTPPDPGGPYADVLSEIRANHEEQE